MFKKIPRKFQKKKKENTKFILSFLNTYLFFTIHRNRSPIGDH